MDYDSDTRDRQILHFSCEFSDRFSNGDRNFTLFPDTSYSAETVVWWDEISKLPGSEKGALASGYSTTYDRLRVISASPVHQVVYNQDVSKKYSLFTAVGFESDGLVVTFMGCQTNNLVTFGSWSSTEENKAYEIRPELCPLGKYGYDPR